MTFNLDKILPKNPIAQYFVIGLYIGIFQFLIFLLFTQNLTTSLFIAIVTVIFAAIGSLINDLLGKTRHKKIIQSKAFLQLINQGFKVEEKKGYYGLTGTHSNYIFDIYYDWSTYLDDKIRRALVFNFYFKSPLDDNSQPDHSLLENIAKKHDASRNFGIDFNFWWREDTLIMKNKIGLFNPSFEKIMERMDIAVKLLQSENLQPLDRKSLEQTRMKDPLACIPEIETYLDNTK